MLKCSVLNSRSHPTWGLGQSVCSKWVDFGFIVTMGHCQWCCGTCPPSPQLSAVYPGPTRRIRSHKGDRREIKCQRNKTPFDLILRSCLLNQAYKVLPFSRYGDIFNTPVYAVYPGRGVGYLIPPSMPEGNMTENI